MVVEEDTDTYLGAGSEEWIQYPLAAVENNAVLMIPAIPEKDNSLEVEVVVGKLEVLMYLGWVVILDWWDCDETMGVLVV